MSNPITVPAYDGIANYPPAIANALVTLATQTQTAVSALQGEASHGDVVARFATTANINLATTALTAIDGVTPVAGNIALVKNQSTASQNGLYVVSAGAWTRLLDDAGNSVLAEGMLVSVAEGTTNVGLLFTLGSDLQTWTNEIGASLATSTPAAVAASGTAGSAVTASKSDHAHADPNRAAAGSNLTDASSQTLSTPGTGWRVIPTLSQNGALTLGTTGAVAGDQLTITRTSTSAFTYAIVNGGGGGGTLVTMPASKQNFALIQFDGTNWALRQCGTQ